MKQWTTNTNKINLTMQKCCEVICHLTLQQEKCMWFSYHRAEFPISWQAPWTQRWVRFITANAPASPSSCHQCGTKKNWPNVMLMQLASLSPTLWDQMKHVSSHYLAKLAFSVLPVNIWAWVIHRLHHVLYLSPNETLQGASKSDR